jgi:hypothetical protein
LKKMAGKFEQIQTAVLFWPSPGTFQHALY